MEKPNVNINITINIQSDNIDKEEINKLIIDEINKNNPFELAAQVGGESITKIRR